MNDTGYMKIMTRKKKHSRILKTLKFPSIQQKERKMLNRRI